MAKICEYVLTKMTFDKNSGVFDIELPTGSQILRDNYQADPKKIFYCWDQKDKTPQKHWIYYVKHSVAGVVLDEKITAQDFIKTFAYENAIWHIFEIKKILGKSSWR